MLYYIFCKIVKNEIGWACGAYGRGEGVGKPEGRRLLGNLGVDGWITLGWISRWDVGIWTGLGWPRIERGGGRL